MSNQVTIEMFPAGNGDAVLIDFGSELILIDAGFVSTFRNHLKPRLETLHNQGKRISKFIVTHIDADHISGAIAFIKANGSADNPNIIGIDDIWFNSYRHLHFEDKEQGDFDGEPPNLSIVSGTESLDPEDDEQLVSHRQGTSFGSQILKNNYSWNKAFGGAAVKADEPIVFESMDTFRLTLLGPTKEALENLAEKWYNYLKTIYQDSINEDAFFDDAFEKMMEEMRQAELNRTVLDQDALVSASGDWVADYCKVWDHEDNSPTNGSSIIFLVEFKGLNMLFLGDAIPGQVENQLEKLIPEDEFPLQIDVLKVAHHGAWYNNSPQLIDKLRANYYLFSSNGKRHHHPHFETMAWILKKHNTESEKTFVFNYRQGDRLIEIDNPQMKQDYNYKTIWPDVNEFGMGSDGYIKLALNTQ
ncbi:MAG: MBL fold metallo-hydrolase [Bacteroidota bacterium]